MKLTILILLITLMQVSASTFGQKVTLKENNLSFDQIFREIRKQTGYDVIMDNTRFKSSRINADFNDTPLENVLDYIVKGTNLSYSIEEKTVVIKERESSFLDRIKDVFNVQEPIKGRVLDDKREPVAGATIIEKGTNNRVMTDVNGEFTLNPTGKDVVLRISFVGYVEVEYKITDKSKGILIVLTASTTKLDEVNVVSTGYQDIPKERATGAFEKVDNKLFNRSVSLDILSRLDGITTSILFNKRIDSRDIRLNPINSPFSYPSIRGISTLSGEDSKKPLIVVDNFPYDGDINNLNPNDIESITVLKDAAAASIWGTRAGNGVIVITTKKGKFEQPFKISINSNVTVTQKPNYSYLPIIKSNDFIDIEEFLYKEGAFVDYVDQMFGNISPVIQILDKRDKGQISETEANEQINILRGTDTRSEYAKSFYRKAVNQQYSLNINGGSKQIRYYLSGGFDKNLNNLVTSNNSRLSLRSNIIFRPVKNLEIEAGILYTETKNKNIGRQFPMEYGELNSLRPYIRFKDNNGNPLEIDDPDRYLIKGYKDTVGGGRLLDWRFRPLAELDQSSNIIKLRDNLLNLGASYKINEVFNTSVKYQYQRNTGENVDWEGLGSYYTRDRINYFSDWTPAIVSRAIPVGDIIETQNLDQASYSARAQLDAKKRWNDQHELTALAGIEIRENHSWTQSNRVYGYNSNTLSTQAVDYYTKQVILAGNDAKELIPRADNFSDRTNRFTSIFANAAYTYKNRYIISASARKDATNFFAVESNQKGSPFWSAGLAWNISKESFYDSGLMPFLKIRTTFGYNGNAVSGLSPKPIITYSQLPNVVTQLNSASVLSPPNPGLKWETVRVINMGVDFASMNNRLSGSIEYYDKLSTDVISNTPVDQGSGFQTLRKNSANLHGQGVDINLNSFNIQTAVFSWMSNFLFSYNRVIVSRSLLTPTASDLIYSGDSGGNIVKTVKGKNVSGIYTYKWARLDPLTGDPQGYVNGLISKDYSTLTKLLSINDLDYHGPSVPTYYGAFRNTFTYRAFSVSVNLQYKFGYKFKRPVVSYSNLYDGYAMIGSGEYADRWQKQGDEARTSVPSLSYPPNPLRDLFYEHSSITIENAAHIRLQDINCSYTISKPNFYFKNLRLYANLNNVGIIWKATKSTYDPEYKLTIPNPRSLTFGLSADF